MLRRAARSTLLDHWEMLGIWSAGRARRGDFPHAFASGSRRCLPLLMVQDREPLGQGGLCVIA
jgi:hypothetical protein